MLEVKRLPLGLARLDWMQSEKRVELLGLSFPHSRESGDIS